MSSSPSLVCRQCVQTDIKEICRLLSISETSTILEEIDQGNFYAMSTTTGQLNSIVCIAVIDYDSHFFVGNLKIRISHLVVDNNGNNGDNNQKNLNIMFQQFINFIKLRIEQVYGKNYLLTSLSPVGTVTIHSDDEKINVSNFTRQIESTIMPNKGICEDDQKNIHRDSKVEKEKWNQFLKTLTKMNFRPHFETIDNAAEYRKIRLSRNLYKINSFEQATLLKKKIGIIGLSAGFHCFQAMAMAGIGGSYKIADHDILDLTNLNRLPFSLQDVNLPKTVIAARNILAMDPFFEIVTFHEGLTEENIHCFLDGLDLVVEECDSFHVKLLVRKFAAKMNISILMATSDRCRLDFEGISTSPTDVNDSRLISKMMNDPEFKENKNSTEFTSLLKKGDVDAKMIFLESFLGDFGGISDRGLASLMEMNGTVSSWSQIAPDVVFGGAQVAHFAQKILLGNDVLQPGVYFGNFGSLSQHHTPLANVDAGSSKPSVISLEEMKSLHKSGDIVNFIMGLIEYGKRASSGGNQQSWVFKINHPPSSTAPTLSVAVDFAYLDTLDPRNCTKYISLGGVLWSIASTCDYLGVAYNLSLDKNDNSIYQFEFPNNDLTTSDIISDGKLAPWIMSRHTDRSIALETPNEGDLEKIDVFLKTYCHNSTVRFVCSDKKEHKLVIKSVAEMDRVRFLCSTFRETLLDETFDGDKSLQQVGVDLRSFGKGLPKHLGGLFRELKSRPGIFSGYTSDDYEKIARSHVDTSIRLLKNSQVLLLITADDNTRQGQINLGVLLHRMWVDATSKGLGFQVISPSTYILDTYRSSHPSLDKMPTKLIPMIEEFEQVLNSAFNFSTTYTGDNSDKCPPILARLFCTNNQIPAIRSLRKDALLK